jgi:predicted RNA methylase
MYPEIPMIEARSTTPSENLQEILDAGGSAGQSLFTGQQQYCTPRWFAEQCQRKLGLTRPLTILDPQVGDGALIALDPGSYGVMRFGVDIDNRLEKTSSFCNLALANTVKVDGILQDIAPDIRFVCVNANPPFGKRWKVGDKMMDSTEYTWDFVTRYGNLGYFIANDKTIRELGLDQHAWATSYETHKANTLWSGLSDSLTIGVVFWRRPLERDIDETWKQDWFNTPSAQVSAIWENVKNIINEEKVSRPDFNIYLEDGELRTYLSFRKQCKDKLSHADIVKLHKINHCHPLTLTTEKESRVLMRSLVDCGFYTIQPEALAAIEDALLQVNSLACPIMPVTDFETVAYADEEDELVCGNAVSNELMSFTTGKRYKLTTGSYKFTEKFTRNKVHFDEDTQTTYTKEHDCQLSGNDRYIEVSDDNGKAIRFMDRPREETGREFPESQLWQIFRKPDVKTVAELKPAAIETNLAVLRSCELMSNYRYYLGQGKYLSRIATKDCGLAAAATGTGKTLMAISLLAMKGPERALIIAPQGTMRSSEVEDDDGEEQEEVSASQWIQEINRFAPFLQVWEIFSHSDYERILSLNGGELPPGVYVSYYQAMFQNGAKERCPSSWDDEKLNKYGISKGLGPLEMQANKTHWTDSVGKEVNGIRCILEPCLATLIGHHFDMVMLDEAHVCCNLGANLTQMLIRLQPKYRWALTATPIPNVVDNLFSLAGWICVDDWYKGNRRNAAWPYARHEQSRFTATFRTMERDFTQEAINKKKDPKNRGMVIRDSPMISSPARLLKLLKSWMAYISKPDVNQNYIPPEIIDVRVSMGREQSVLYGHFLDRANIDGHPLTRARKQSAWLRGICCDPMHFRHGGPKVTSNMNPKVIAILELVRDILAAGEQVVIINSRVGLSDTLQQKLVEAGVPISRIDSTIPAEQHAAQANLFKSGRARVKLMGIKCASAYSFDACANEIIGSIEYSPGPLTQAVGRIDRVTNAVKKKIYCILNKNSIEEIMFDTVALKDDAATICLKGQRVPRTFKPVDGSELLASAIEHFDLSGSTPESECEAQWPKLRKRIADALLTSAKP